MLIESESFHPHMGKEGLYLSGTAGRHYNSEGDVVGAIESVRDITAAKRSEKEREQLILSKSDIENDPGGIFAYYPWPKRPIVLIQRSVMWGSG